MQLLRQSICRYHDSPPKTARKYLTTKIKKEKKSSNQAWNKKKPTRITWSTWQKLTGDSSAKGTP